MGDSREHEEQSLKSYKKRPLIESAVVCIQIAGLLHKSWNYLCSVQRACLRKGKYCLCLKFLQLQYLHRFNVILLP